MSIFFSNSPGRVKRVEPAGGGNSSPSVIMRIQGGAGSDTNVFVGPNTRNMIVTQMSLSQQGNVQFLHTIGNAIYAYVFGNRMGELRVSGLCFAECGDNAPGSLGPAGPASAGPPGQSPVPTAADNGVIRLLDTYKARRVSNSPTPVDAFIGGHTFRAFLVSMNLEIPDPSLPLAQWTYLLNTFPE